MPARRSPGRRRRGTRRHASRGRTPGDGSEPHLLSGGSLFPGGPGNTQKDPARFPSLMDDQREVLRPLPDETWIDPGHGKDTTLGAERPSVPGWRERGW